MKPVRANFQTRKGPRRWMWAAVALPFVIAGVLGVRALLDWQEKQVREHEQMRSTQLARESLARAAEEPLYASGVRDYLRQASSDWPSALRAMERTQTDQVSVRAIEIIPAERKVVLEVAYTDGAALGDFVVSLNAGYPEPRWQMTKISGTGNAKLELGTAYLTGRLE